jgi:Flp pilus assembly protein TadG
MSIQDERGLIGKALVIWLIILAIVVLGIFDAVSITTTRFHMSDIAAQAAQDGANAYHDSNSPTEKTACDAAAASVAAADSTIHMTACSFNVDTKELTITVRKTAHTIAAGHIGFLEKFTHVEDTETVGPSAL